MLAQPCMSAIARMHSPVPYFILRLTLRLLRDAAGRR
jgi:hypothetical protein